MGIYTNWASATNTTYDDPAAWDNGVPSAGDHVQIVGPGICTVNVDSGMLADLYIGGNVIVSTSCALRARTITHNLVSPIHNFGTIQNDADAIYGGLNGFGLASDSTGEIDITGYPGNTVFVTSSGIISLLKLTGSTGPGAPGFYVNASNVTSLDVSGITGTFHLFRYISGIFNIPSGQHLTMPSTPSWLIVESINSAGGGTIYAIRGTNGGGNTNWVFTLPTYTLTYTAGAHGSISGTTPQTVTSGNNGTAVTAVPAFGYTFTSWSDGVLTATRQELNVTANHSVTATFTIIPPSTVRYLLDDAESGYITGSTSQSVAYGGNGTPVTCVPYPNFLFKGWNDGVKKNERQELNVTTNLNLIAQFLSITP
jgi:hypothetical protein